LVGKGKGNSHSTSLAHSTVVYKVGETSDRQSNNNPKNQKLVKNSISGQKTPASGKVSSNSAQNFLI
jgi:hypothetical protein